MKGKQKKKKNKRNGNIKEKEGREGRKKKGKGKRKEERERQSSWRTENGRKKRMLGKESKRNSLGIEKKLYTYIYLSSPSLVLAFLRSLFCRFQELFSPSLPPNM